MYNAHYGFNTDPFHVTPDASLVYLTKAHREAIGALDYGLRLGKGFIVITGEVGTGKTTVLRHSLRKLDATTSAIVYVLQPALTPRQLLALVWRELAESPEAAAAPEDMGELVRHLLHRLQELHDAGKTIVIVIDEAQTMPVETLESLRLLSNLETDKEKFVQIILAGQPELDDKLARHELRQLNQRVAVRARIANLSPAESLAYLRFRMQSAAGKPIHPFSKTALDYIIAKSGGNPRRLNIFCDNALINGVGYGVPVVSREIAIDAIAPHLMAEYPNRSPLSFGMSASSRNMALSIVALIGVGFIIGVVLQMAPGETGRSSPAPRPIAYSKPGASIEPDTRAADAVYATRPDAPPTRAVATALAGTPIWTVREGETLAHICAQAYGLCTRGMVTTLARANPTLDPQTLIAGQRVALPVIENLKPVVP